MKLPSLLQDSAGLPIEHVLLLVDVVVDVDVVTCYRLHTPTATAWCLGGGQPQASQQRRSLWLVAAQHTPPSPPPLLQLGSTVSNIYCCALI